MLLDPCGWCRIWVKWRGLFLLIEWLCACHVPKYTGARDVGRIGINSKLWQVYVWLSKMVYLAQP